MISAADWDAYNAAVSNMADGMARRAELLILAWMEDNPDASAAEIREAAKSIMEGIAQVADEAAAALAAEWYDAQARASGAALEPAVTAVVYNARDVDRAARYQAKKLAEGDRPGFARRCGEFVRNDALKSLNETVIANVGRDSDAGARFARVMTGSENCAFCLMLASRGAVYHTRETAGEFRSFHRNCDCKVVPSFSDDPMDVLVEGRDPKELYRRWRRIESARKSRERAYEEDAESLRGEIEEYDAGLKNAWKLHGRIKSAESYRDTYAAYVRDVVPSNPISIDDFTKIEAKELQEARWLARMGHEVAFRNANDNDVEGGNTSDVLVDGTTCDFKKIESSSIRKMARRITEKLDRQGPWFLVDLSTSSISRDAAEMRLAELLDDDRIEGFYLVSGGEIETIKK